jgi:hypothetical protein
MVLAGIEEVEEEKDTSLYYSDKLQRKSNLIIYCYLMSNKLPNESNIGKRITLWGLLDIRYICLDIFLDWRMAKHYYFFILNVSLTYYKI